MTRDEFKQLQVGDRVTHPAFIGFLTITRVETSYDYSTTPATKWTDTITTDNGRRLKIIDERDVRLLRKL
ncbi:MAG TPA: hypothetical protein EYP41_01185 [Anaerolineae bacterium]|nr:hypothetical protein [Anaerolineae bacterium]HIP70520.1 hypothetical protein [Anaerolineae bacterium]